MLFSTRTFQVLGLAIDRVCRRTKWLQWCTLPYECLVGATRSSATISVSRRGRAFDLNQFQLDRTSQLLTCPHSLALNGQGQQCNIHNSVKPHPRSTGCGTRFFFDGKPHPRRGPCGANLYNRLRRYRDTSHEQGDVLGFEPRQLEIDMERSERFWGRANY